MSDGIKTRSANDTQVGGDHYKSSIQHWDYVIANDLDYFQAQVTKYVTRWKKKAGLQDLEKARHFLDKYIETEKLKIEQKKNDISSIRGKVGQVHPFGYVAEDN